MKFQVTVSREQSSTSIRAQLDIWPSLAVLQVHSEIQSVGDLCPIVYVGIRNPVEKLPKKSRIFYLGEIENDPQWFVKVVDELPEHVYYMIDPGALSWEKILDLSKEVTHRRNIVAMEVAESCPQEMINQLLILVNQ